MIGWGRHTRPYATARRAPPFALRAASRPTPQHLAASPCAACVELSRAQPDQRPRHVQDVHKRARVGGSFHYAPRRKPARRVGDRLNLQRPTACGVRPTGGPASRPRWLAGRTLRPNGTPAGPPVRLWGSCPDQPPYHHPTCLTGPAQVCARGNGGGVPPGGCGGVGSLWEVRGVCASRGQCR